jgi:hypothetical protein
MLENSKVPVGLQLVIGFHLLNIVLWTIGQGGSVISYDLVAQWGLQDPRTFIDPAIVEVNRGIGLADMIIMIPLFIIAVIGLLGRKFYGAVASWLALGISLYWPVVFLCSQFFYGKNGIKHNPTDTSTIFILTFLLLITIWASWYLYNNRKLFK